MVNNVQTPPPPPYGAFDVRYESQRIVEAYRTDKEQNDFIIKICSASYPIKNRWNINVDQKYLFVLIGGTSEKKIVYEPLNTETGEMVITNKNLNSLILRVSRIPENFALFQNYPHPFNPSTTIRYDLPKETFVRLIVYNILGQEVATLVNGKCEAGRYEVEFNGTDLPSGIYFYTLKADDYLCTKKLVIIK